MDTFAAIEQRRSVKHYDPSHRMTDEEIRKLIGLAILSPTSINMQNWRFVVARDPALRQQLRAASWNQAQVTDASIWVILCADLLAFKKQPERYWRTAPSDVGKMMVQMLGMYEGREQLQRDEALRSCGIAAQTIMLAAKAMGYDSCPMAGFDPDAVGRLIKLPPDHVIALAIAVGKPLQPARPRGGQLPLDDVLFFDRF
jgi:nitroreductase